MAPEPAKPQLPIPSALLCRIDCVDDGCGPADMNGGDDFDTEGGPEDVDSQVRPPDRPRRGLTTYSADVHLPLVQPAIRTGEVWHLAPEDGKTFRLATLSLHPNGISVQPHDDNFPSVSVAWSPFSLVQACRLHTSQADKSQPWMRLFKISVFHHGLTHFFATHGENADMERTRWVADTSRALRTLTQSLYPPFELRTDPVPNAPWTATRLLAGYLLLYDELGVSLVYGELHAHWDTSATFAAYEDELCEIEVLHLSVDMHTCVSERVGIDCSCFSLGEHHFSGRTCAEKMLWLRAISNVKVKLRHWVSNPTGKDLRHYRAAVRENAKTLPLPKENETSDRGPLLPHRNCGNAFPNKMAMTGAYTTPSKPLNIVAASPAFSPTSTPTPGINDAQTPVVKQAVVMMPPSSPAFLPGTASRAGTEPPLAGSPGSDGPPSPPMPY